MNVSKQLRSLCYPKGSALLLVMSYSSCTWKHPWLQSSSSCIPPCTASAHSGRMRSLWPRRTLALEVRESTNSNVFLGLRSSEAFHLFTRYWFQDAFLWALLTAAVSCTCAV